mmetsp:Transcript_4865/g.7755  ORF Transcript_4865/g.7755 Transcript_4865/m.7755 type:complete len:82 (+) Transcript_4865:16-261(+)
MNRSDFFEGERGSSRPRAGTPLPEDGAVGCNYTSIMRTFSQFNEKGEREHNRVQKQFRKCRNRPKEELVTDAATGEKMWCV